MVSEKIVERALALVAEGGGNYEYFFSQLKSPEWITPLHRRGRFSHPPEAISEGDYVQFPRWPEGEYLLRMAQQAPNEVYGVLSDKSFESNNHAVHEILMEIATILPPTLSADLALREAKWVSEQRKLYGLYPEKAARLISSLAADVSEAWAAVTLLGKIFDVASPPERDESMSAIGGEGLRWHADPLGKIAIWDIERVMSIVAEPLAGSAPDAFLSTLSEILDKAIRIHDNGRGNEEDFSTIWRPHIATGDNLDRLGALAGSLQIATRLVAEGREGGYETALRVLSKREWPIFRRFESYALSVASSVSVRVVEQMLTDPSRYRDATANPEFNELLGKCFGTISDTAKREILSIIDAGPDLGLYSQFLEREEQHGTRADSEAWIREDWQLRWLFSISEHLDSPRRELLESLKAKHGPPRPAYEVRGGAVGHYSDVPDEDLRRLGPVQLVEFLKNWTPPPQPDPYSPSRAGLALAVCRWLAEDPAYFSSILDRFHDPHLHPTFLRSLLDGFTSALRTEKQFEVLPVIRAIVWVFENTRATSNEEFRWEEDPGWSWTYMSSARFLTELFLHAERLDVGWRDEIWPALRLVSEAKSPSAQDEEAYRKRSDFGTLALNSTRPVGIEAAMRYARWLKLAGIEVNAKTTPEIFDLLRRHLDPAVDDSVAVREIFGMHFQLLAWLDEQWFEKQLEALFPDKPYNMLDKFAWGSFLSFGRPVASLLPAMRFRYERAINSLDSKTTEIDDLERKLGDHLMRFVAAGTVDLDDPLLRLFFSRASHSLRAQTVGDVGWHLGRQTEELEPSVRDRLMAFWASRFSACLFEGMSAKQEAGSFGWWLQSKKFPDSWAIEQAILVVDKFRCLNPDFAVIRRLAELSRAYPFEAVHCLGVIFEEDREGWAIHGWGDHVKTILESALQANSRSHDEAVHVINLLVARGNRGYRHLL